MRAIIETSQTQIPVELDARCRIPRIEAEIGKEISFDKVLIISGEKEPVVGNPYVQGALVTGEVVRHGRDDKVVIFKFKRRTKYRRKAGHKQDFTEVLIKKISH